MGGTGGGNLLNVTSSAFTSIASSCSIRTPTPGRTMGCRQRGQWGWYGGRPGPDQMSRSIPQGEQYHRLPAGGASWRGGMTAPIKPNRAPISPLLMIPGRVSGFGCFSGLGLRFRGFFCCGAFGFFIVGYLRILKYQCIDCEFAAFKCFGAP